MIYTIIFDLGRVLVNFEPYEYLEKLYPGEDINNLFKQIFMNEEWLDLDRGIISNEEAIKRISQRCHGDENKVRYIINNWASILTPIEGSIKILYELKEKGYKIFLLSNFHEKAFLEVLSSHEFFDEFDGMTVSYTKNIIKPDKKIFEEMCLEHDINPKTSVFIDDTMVNINAAMELGFETIHFKNPEILKTKLLELKIL